MVHAPVPLAVGAMLEVKHEVRQPPDSGYLSVRPGTKIKVLYVGSADEEGWIFAESESAEQGWLSATSTLSRDADQSVEKKAALHLAERGWLPEQPNQLRIRKGDQFYIERQEGGWIYGRLREGSGGWFSDLVLTKPPLPEGPRPRTDGRLPPFLIGQKAPNVPWSYVLQAHDCYVASLPADKVATLTEPCDKQAWATYWLKRVNTGIEDLGGWDRPLGSLGVMSRGTKWLVREGCTCPYNYGGAVVKAKQFPDWMHELLQQVMPLCGLSEEEWPNSCNVNLYVNADALSWHADDEPLMDTPDGNCCIVSLSLGQERTFQLKPNGDQEASHELKLGGGAMCTMEGQTQRLYQHRVCKGGSGFRINLTWRWITKHHRDCKNSRWSTVI